MRHVASLFGGFALFVLVAIISSEAVRAAEESVPLDQVPKAVTDAVKKRFPKGELTEAAKEDEDGKTIYEVTVKDGGKKIDVTLTPEGTITMIEKEMAAKDLPKAVTEAVEKKYPKATYQFAEEINTVKDGKETLSYYEVLIETAEKKRMEIELAPDGTIKKEEVKGADEKP